MQPKQIRVEPFVLIPRCLFQRDALARLSLYETADLCRDFLPPAVLLPSKPHPLLPSRGLDLISPEKEACVHIPIHLCCLNTALYVSCFFYPPLPTPVNLLSLSGTKKNKNKKKAHLLLRGLRPGELAKRRGRCL